MKTIIQLEEAAMFCFSVYALYLFQVNWWVYLLLLIGPDISMLGYVAGNRTGAVIYDLFHHKLIAITFFLLGWFGQVWLLQVIGIILFGHSSMDRMFGYGLKYFKGFAFTHLGEIGRNSTNRK